MSGTLTAASLSYCRGAVSFLMIGTVLLVLEISLLFGKTIVKAHSLRDMAPACQPRFLTAGLLTFLAGEVAGHRLDQRRSGRVLHRDVRDAPFSCAGVLGAPQSPRV